MDRVRSALFLGEPRFDGTGVRIAVLDTGVDPEHPDLRDCLDLAESQSFIALGGDLLDRSGHGTHVAGIIAGSGALSDRRYRGVAPGAELIIMKIAPLGGRGYSDDVAAAVFRAIELQVDIINYSAGQAGYKAGPPPWKWSSKLDLRDQAFQAAADEGILCVAAVGNEGPAPGTVNRPAFRRGVLAVGALTEDGKRLYERSSRGPVYLDPSLPVNAVERASPPLDEPVTDRVKPDVVAPGGTYVDVSRYGSRRLESLGIADGPVSTRSRLAEGLAGLDPADPAASYACIAGTSQAAAVVTGLAALLIEMGNTRGFDWSRNRGHMLRQIFRFAAVKLQGHDTRSWGHGATMWPSLMTTLQDSIDRPDVRERVLEGPQIQLLP